MKYDTEIIEMLIRKSISFACQGFFNTHPELDDLSQEEKKTWENFIQWCYCQNGEFIAEKILKNNSDYKFDLTDYMTSAIRESERWWGRDSSVCIDQAKLLVSNKSSDSSFEEPLKYVYDTLKNEVDTTTFQSLIKYDRRQKISDKVNQPESIKKFLKNRYSELIQKRIAHINDIVMSRKEIESNQKEIDKYSKNDHLAKESIITKLKSIFNKNIKSKNGLNRTYYVLRDPMGGKEKFKLKKEFYKENDQIIGPIITYYEDGSIFQKENSSFGLMNEYYSIRYYKSGEIFSTAYSAEPTGCNEESHLLVFYEDGALFQKSLTTSNNDEIINVSGNNFTNKGDFFQITRQIKHAEIYPNFSYNQIFKREEIKNRVNIDYEAYAARGETPPKKDYWSYAYYKSGVPLLNPERFFKSDEFKFLVKETFKELDKEVV